VEEGETLAVVGESGCGKSVGMLSILQLLQQTTGKVERGEAWFRGVDLLKLSDEEIRKKRGKDIGMIFQDPMTSLNPVLNIQRQMTEGLVKHLRISRKEALGRAIQLLDLVGIPNAEKRINEYTFQFSGGMRQRVMIAMALACEPQLLIADEPTTALDVTIQAQIMNLVRRLKDQFGMAIVWITHDLGIVANFAQRVQVMYAGYIVEKADVKNLFARASHPYSIGLLNSLPSEGVGRRQRLIPIKGSPPNLLSMGAGCPFAPRCIRTTEQCLAENPALSEYEPGHMVACWKAGGTDK
jgi:oligopeptide transport system ATP-binding protein